MLHAFIMYPLWHSCHLAKDLLPGGLPARSGPELAQHAQAGLPPALAPAYSACAPYPALHTAIPRVSATAIAVPRGFDESFVWQI